MSKGTSGSSKNEGRSSDRHLFQGHNKELTQETRGWVVQFWVWVQNLVLVDPGKPRPVILFWPRRFSDGTTRSRNFHTFATELLGFWAAVFLSGVSRHTRDWHHTYMQYNGKPFIVVGDYNAAASPEDRGTGKKTPPI